MGQLIPFTGGTPATPGTPAPLVLVTPGRPESRYEIASLGQLRGVLARGIAPADVQYDCTDAADEEIATARGCGVRRFAIDSGTPLGELSGRESVLVRVAATAAPIWRAVLAGLHVEGVIVERVDLARTGEVCTRLALDGLPMRTLQVDCALTVEERRAVAAAFPYGPALWFAIAWVDDDASAGPEEPGLEALVRVLRDGG